MPVFNLVGRPRSPSTLPALPEGIEAVPLEPAETAVPPEPCRPGQGGARNRRSTPSTAPSSATPTSPTTSSCGSRAGPASCTERPAGEPLGYGYSSQVGRFGPVALLDETLIAPGDRAPADRDRAARRRQRLGPRSERPSHGRAAASRPPNRRLPGDVLLDSALRRLRALPAGRPGAAIACRAPPRSAALPRSSRAAAPSVLASHCEPRNAPDPARSRSRPGRRLRAPPTARGHSAPPPSATSRPGESPLDGTPALVLRGVTKTYGNGKSALRDVNLTVPDGRLRLPRRPFGGRQVDPHPAAHPRGAGDQGQGPAGGPRPGQAQAPRSAQDQAPHRHRLPGLQAAAQQIRPRQRRLRPRGDRHAAREDRPGRRSSPARRRPVRPRPTSGPASCPAASSSGPPSPGPSSTTRTSSSPTSRPATSIR